MRSIRTVWGVLACLLLEACTGCQTFACVNGIRVTLARPPVAPYTVETLVNGAALPGSVPARCAVGESCPTTVFFGGTPAENVSLRVTTAQGVRTTDFPTVSYRSERPDDGCVTCRYADLVAQVP